MIEDHIERRVAIFFQQLVLCYGTKLHFEIGDTLHQGKSATALYLKDQNGKCEKLSVRNAAHSSTIPCLIASDLKAWTQHKQHGQKEPQGFVYIKNSGIYNNATATMEMSRNINEAEIKKIFANTPSSQSTISRLENGGKCIEPAYAAELSAVFKVDPALFMPAFFHS